MIPDGDEVFRSLIMDIPTYRAFIPTALQRIQREAVRMFGDEILLLTKEPVFPESTMENPTYRIRLQLRFK